MILILYKLVLSNKTPKYIFTDLCEINFVILLCKKNDKWQTKKEKKK